MHDTPRVLTLALSLSLTLAGCPGAGKGGDDSAAGGDDSADGGRDTSPIEVPEDNIASALGDCAGYQRDPEEYPNQLSAGDELQRYTLMEPEAVCNDGTRAVIYVRPATSEALADVWSIHLQGGGACASYLGCAVRWCGVDYYDWSKMSAADLPLEVNGFGIYDAGDANLLAGANQVFFYYCSSDAWRGVGSASYSAEDVELPEDEGVEVPFELPDYTIFRRGHTILEAGLDELAEGLVADGGDEMPPLDDASLVVFNGTSGGSSGARFNADWVQERLSAQGAEVFAIFDAANTPSGDFWGESYETILQERQATSWALLQDTESPLPFTDESCLDTLGGSEDESDCYEADYLMWNHITTPFFVRQDLRDTTGSAEAVGIPEDEHEEAVADMLAALAELPERAAEGEAITRIPGAYGPNCAQHVALESTAWWAESTVEDGEGVAWSFQGAVVSWYQGADVSVIDEPLAGEGDGARSSCADVDAER